MLIFGISSWSSAAADSRHTRRRAPGDRLRRRLSCAGVWLPGPCLGRVVGCLVQILVVAKPRVRRLVRALAAVLCGHERLAKMHKLRSRACRSARKRSPPRAPGRRRAQRARRTGSRDANKLQAFLWLPGSEHEPLRRSGTSALRPVACEKCPPFPNIYLFTSRVRIFSWSGALGRARSGPRAEQRAGRPPGPHFGRPRLPPTPAVPAVAGLHRDCQYRTRHLLFKGLICPFVQGARLRRSAPATPLRSALKNTRAIRGFKIQTSI